MGGSEELEDPAAGLFGVLSQERALGEAFNHAVILVQPLTLICKLLGHTKSSERQSVLNRVRQLRRGSVFPVHNLYSFRERR
jgi:hypothetical protein